MISITNEKVAGFAPRWAPFRGISLLFDNPGATFRDGNGVEYIDDVLDGVRDMQLFNALRTGIERVGCDFLIHTYLFCPLPPASYHITVCDGVNDANVASVRADRRQECMHFLHRLPGSIAAHHPFTEIVDSASVVGTEWSISFRFERLENWSDVSLVARLAPADEMSANALRRLTASRADLANAFEAEFGVRPSDTYVPHVTLGYFADRSVAGRVGATLDQWEPIFRHETGGLSLPVRSVSAYGFTDMSTFFRAGRH